MSSFNIIKRGAYLLLLNLVTVQFVHAQEADSSSTSIDTSRVVVASKIKGEKLKGIIIDGNTNIPVVGASISINGYSASTSDEKGNFIITLPPYKTSLEINNEGYHTKFIPVFKGKSVLVKIYPITYPSLYAEAHTSQEYKSQSRLVGAFSTTGSSQVWSNNSETPGSFLQGKFAGVNATRRSGTAGIGADIYVRGFNSLIATNQPLYVVDGVIYDANSYGVSLTSGHVNNPLQYIDVRDIENITVAKDAVSSAMYGTRAGNGVIFITTNHAKQLATNIDFSAFGGVNFAPAHLPVMNAANFRTYLSDVLGSQGLTSSQVGNLPYINNQDPSYNSYVFDTDWQDEVFRTAMDQNYYLRVTGGDNIAKYSLSVGYIKDKGITDSTNYTRYNTRFNADLNLSKRLTGNANLAMSFGEQYLKDQGQSPVTNPIFLALVKSPFMNPHEVNSAGKISPNLADADTLNISNPVAVIYNGINRKKSYRFSGSVNFDYKVNTSIKISNTTGITYDKDQESIFIPRRGTSADTVRNVIVNSTTGTQVVRYFSFNNDLRATFNKKINNVHNLNLTGGFRYTQNNSEQDYGIGFNTGTDQLLSVGNSDLSSRIFGGGIGVWRTINTYGIGEYNYSNKYFINGTIAVDGSSRFGKKAEHSLKIGDSRFAVLPAIGFAWLVSSEEFMRNMKAIELLKFRVSYGVVGNDDIGNYTARQYYGSQNLLGLEGYVRGNVANPYLQWEAVKKFNTGVDASFFNERLNLSLDVYSHKTDQMLTVGTLNTEAGLGSYISNNSGMRTSGVDLQLNGRLVKSKAVKWDASLSLGTYKNKITSMPLGSMYTSYYGGTYITSVGQSANLFYGYRTNGVYSSDAEAAKDGLSIRTTAGELIPFKGGDVRFVNVDNDSQKVIDENDRVVIGDPNPDFFGGLDNTITFKRWTFNALFTFVAGNDIYNYTRAELESGKNYYNQSNAMLNRWRGEGQITNIPRATYGDPMGNSRFSDRWIEDGSYVRLRTLSVTYDIPFKGKMLKYAKVYATANNVFTLSKYMGYDPEFSSTGSPFGQGVDTTLEPQVKSAQLGIRIGL